MANPYTPLPAETTTQVVYQTTAQPSIQNGEVLPEKFTGGGGCKDIFFNVLFWAHLAGIAAIFGVAVTRNDNNIYIGILPDFSMNSITTFIEIFGILAGSGIVLSFLVLQLARMAPKAFIYGAVIFNLAAFIAIAIYGAVMTSWAYTIVFGLFVLVWIFFFFAIRVWIPFAAELLRAVATVITLYPTTWLASFLTVLMQVGWIMFWTYTVLLVQHRFSDAAIKGLSALLILSFFWTYQTIKNVLHSTHCGLFASWYFLYPQMMPSSPVAGSFGRSMTTSFGSIALGSFIVALLQTLRTLLRSGRNSRSILAILATCFLACFEAIARYFNTYAFAYCAIYGLSFCQAARSVIDMFSRSGFAAILNDSLFDKILFMVSSFGAVSLGAIGYFIAPQFFVANYSTPYYYAHILSSAGGFIMGWIIMSTVVQIIESGVVTIFVCFAEDKEVLHRNQPALYNNIMETFGGQLVAATNV